MLLAAGRTNLNTLTMSCAGSWLYKAEYPQHFLSEVCRSLAFFGGFPFKADTVYSLRTPQIATRSLELPKKACNVCHWFKTPYVIMLSSLCMLMMPKNKQLEKPWWWA